MTTKDEALKLALKKAFDLGKRYWQQVNSDFTSQWRKSDVTLASFNQLVEDTIREALAEQPAQQQEPVAYVDGDEAHRRILWEPSQAAFDLAVGTKIYTHPPVIDKSAAIRIATALGWEPKREWVGLTGHEQKALMSMNVRDAVFKAEQMLKERNT